MDQLFGKGEEALNFYLSFFPNSKIESITKDEKTKSVMHCSFKLLDQEFALMEGAGKHGHTFTHATSIVVNCDTQEEIDFYWGKLSAGGSTEPCGWLRDKFGVSWQITPKDLGNLMSDPAKSDKAAAAMLTMSKIDLQTILNAANSP